jgi:RNA recognition motif-containing protein
MAKNIYVGNLPFSTTDDELNDLFAPYGAVKAARVIKDRITERSRGFGFVEMENDEEADKAIAEVNGKDLDGRPLKVSEARPREDRRGGGGGY